MSQRSSKHSFRPLFIILGLGIVLRACLLSWFAGHSLYVVDEQHYNSIAVNLAQSGSFANGDGTLTSMRPPLYPLFLSAVYRVAGIENYQAVRIVQIVISCLTVCVVYGLARELYRERVAIWAAAATCLYPSLVGFGNLLLTETLFAFLICSASLLLAWYFKTHRPVWLVGFGATLALAALTRSVLWVFPPFLMVFMWFAAGPQTTWRRRLLLAIVPTAAFGLVLLPWGIRNTRLQKTFTVIDNMGGRNFMMGNYEHTPETRIWDTVSIEGDASWNVVLAKKAPHFQGLTEGQKDKVALRHGLQFVMHHPWITMRRCLIKFNNFWQLERTLVAGMHRGFWGNSSRSMVLLTAAIVIASYVAAMLAAVFGYVVTPSKNLRVHCFILLLVGFICAVHSAVFGHSRYHLALMPLVLIYSAAGADQLGLIWSRRGQPRFLLAGFVCALLALGWIWEIASVDFERFLAVISLAA